MRKYVRKAFYSFLSIVNTIIKKEKRIVIYGGHSLSDNSEAIFRYLVENTDYEIVCITDSHMDYQLREKVYFVDDTVWNAVHYMLSSKVVFDSSLHKVKMKPTNNQIFFQLWHGSPLKYLQPSNSVINDGDYYSFICYAAEFFKEPMKFPFGAKDSQMLLNGNPRCDYLFKSVNETNLYRKTSKSVLWLPTYRSGLAVNYKGSEIPIINAENIGSLNEFLKEKDITVYIKPHPLQKVDIKKMLAVDELSNIKIVSNEELIENNVPLYVLLGAMDALLTDYSSVYFDYLLIDKPIGFAIDDIQTYKEEVGYIIDNPLEYMPGNKIYNMEQLCEFFDDLVKGTDLHKKERDEVNNLVNYYKDGNNACRVVEVIKDIMK